MGKKKPTIGYWYKSLYHLGICRGPVDALLEFRGGDKTAWKGLQTESGIIAIDALELWGGEKKEGGIQGDLHVMMGEATQAPNAMLAAELGPEQSAYRGRTTMAFTGRYGAFNPYPKPPWFKLCRILKGWDGDVCWYPDKAGISIAPIRAPIVSTYGWVDRATPYFTIGAAQEVSGFYSTFQGWLDGNIDCIRVTRNACRYSAASYPPPSAEWSATGAGDPFWANVLLQLRMIGTEGSTAITDDKGHLIEANGGAKITTTRSKFGGSSAVFDGANDWIKANVPGEDDLGASFTIEAWIWLDTLKAGSGYANGIFGYGPTEVGGSDTALFVYNDTLRYLQLEPGNLSRPSINQNAGPFLETGRWAFVSIGRNDATGEYYLHVDGILATATGSELGMNPAHILYDSLTSADMKGEPVELINEASFTAAADLFYAEGFGLCTTYDAGSESVEQFQQRILNVIGANLSQSRTNGEYYLTPVRGDYVLGDLPILSDDDILEYSEEPSDPLESVNQVAVEWFDQVTRTKRTTTPLQALGAIQAVGAVLADTISYPEIPSESLALRCAARDLAQKSTPLKRIVLTTTRKPYDWRAGDFFRLQAPRRGIADMVCMLGEIGAGVRRSGSIRIRAIQDVSGMPTATYVEAEPGIDTSPSQTPTAPPVQAAVEAPYIELVTSIPTAELAVLAPDGGFVSAFAARPTAGFNFDLWSQTGSEAYEDRGDGDWCPYATIVEAAGPVDTVFTLADAQDVNEVLVGQAALWDGEIVRVTAVDADAGTIELARGCADTTPAIEHTAGQGILFFGGATASDEREYSGGETVQVRLLSRTTSALFPLALAATNTILMASRAARPYPPGRLRITDDIAPNVAYPAAAVGEIEVTWAHRDRLLQEDQLIDQSAASIGPEAGTTYTVRYYVDAVLDHTESGITGTAATPHTMGSAGICLVEVEAVRDGLLSWQPAKAEFSYTVLPFDERITDSSDTRITDSGDRRTTD